MRHIVNEVTRKNLVGKTKVGSPTRYNKRLRYSAMSIPEIDEEQLLNNDMLVIRVQVGKYVCTIAFEGVIKKLVEIVKRDRLHRVIRRFVVQALNQQVDITENVYVRCSCPDFRFRYSYYATKYEYIWGAPENRPAKITNPYDSIGATCKHLVAILANKKWLVKAASVVNDFIHDNYEEIIKNYNINPEEFVVHQQQYIAAVTGAVKRDMERMPIPLLALSNRLYDPETLEDDLYSLIGNKGWYIRVDHDLDKPVAVMISKSEKALEGDDSDKQPVYSFDVNPAGTKVRISQLKDEGVDEE